MNARSDDEKFERLARTIHPRSKLLRTWVLKGGISAHTTALEIERSDGRTEKLIVRRHGDEDLRHNVVCSAGVAAQAFRACDGGKKDDGIPYDENILLELRQFTGF